MLGRPPVASMYTSTVWVVLLDKCTVVCPELVRVNEVTRALWMVLTPRLLSLVSASAPIAGRSRGSRRSPPESIVVEVFG